MASYYLDSWSTLSQQVQSSIDKNLQLGSACLFECYVPTLVLVHEQPALHLAVLVTEKQTGYTQQATFLSSCSQ